VKVIKTSGHCYDGMGWTDCDFWKHGDSEETSSKCTLFGINGVSKDASKSLILCDRIYGLDYEGEV